MMSVQPHGLASDQYLESVHGLLTSWGNLTSDTQFNTPVSKILRISSYRAAGQLHF